MLARLLLRFAPARLWARIDPLSRAVIGLGLLALLGPFGEMVDVAVFAAIDPDFVAFDFGLEAIVTLILAGYTAAMLLLVMAKPGRGRSVFSCLIPIVVARIASRLPLPPQHVPIA